MSEAALDAVAEILNLVESLGTFPAKQKEVFIQLMDKPTGGTRPIGWYRALYRVWVRARRKCWRAWEARSDPKHMFGSGVGRTVEDIVWRQSFRAEAAVAKREEAAAVLHDLKK
eukprot:6630159-Karenia_brevis.AAC.1